jgi:uncharacterized protein
VTRKKPDGCEDTDGGSEIARRADPAEKSMEIGTELLVIVPVVVFAAYVVFGLSGFGSALINVPILAHFLPLTTVVPLTLLLDFSASMLVRSRFKAGVQWREISVLVPFAAVGTVTGVFLLINLPREQALLTLGALVGFYGLYSLLRRRPNMVPISRLWSVPTGVAAGVVGGLFGMGGPFYVIYLSRRLNDLIQLKATLAGIFSLQTAMRIVALLISGLLLQRHVLLGAAALFPVMWIGLRVGHDLHTRLSRERVLQVVSLVLVAAGGTLIFRALS